MSDIFLSYASEDRARAELVAKALAAQGWSVWWDRMIPAGKTFPQVINEEIDKASCVVALWSRTSVEKEWVLEEASAGKKRGILVPVIIDPVELPWGFRLVQAADLAGWKGDTTTPSFRRLCSDILATIGRAPKQAQGVSPPPAGIGIKPIKQSNLTVAFEANAPWRSLNKGALLGSVAALMAVAAAWVIWSRLPSGVGRLAVTANVVGARVAIDGQNQPDCVTPCAFKLPAGNHHVAGTKPGYASVEQDVTIEAGQGRSVNLSFEPPPTPHESQLAYGRLTVTTNVAGAQIAINGQSRPDCVTPCDINLAAGEYRVAGTKLGYDSAEQDVMLAAGQSSSINLRLARFASPSLAAELQGRIKARITEGEVDYQHGQYDEAIHALREAIGLKPGDADAAKAHRDLGMALSHKQEWDEAIRECRTAIGLNPNDALAHSELGVALGHKGDWNGAITEEQAAVRLDANNALSHCNLGVALKAKGDQRAALAEFRKAHELDPANPVITTNYVRLLNQVN